MENGFYKTPSKKEPEYYQVRNLEIVMEVWGTRLQTRTISPEGIGNWYALTNTLLEASLIKITDISQEPEGIIKMIASAQMEI